MVPFWGQRRTSSPSRPWQRISPLDREDTLPLHIHSSASSSAATRERCSYDLDEYLHSLDLGDPEEHGCPVTCAAPTSFLPVWKQRRGVQVSMNNSAMRHLGDRGAIHGLGVDREDSFDQDHDEDLDELLLAGPGTRRESDDIDYDALPHSPSISRARRQAGSRAAMVTAAVLVLSSCTTMAALACRRSWQAAASSPDRSGSWPPGSPNSISRQHFQVKAGVQVSEGNGSDASSPPSCFHSASLSNFSTQQAMIQSGWHFNWSDTFAFKPSIYKGFIPKDSYWGFSASGYASIGVTLHGFGNVTLDFGNLLGTPGSTVSVLRNLAVVSSASASTLSKVVSIPFAPEDELRIVENPRGIIILNSISVRCSTSQEAPGKVVRDAHEVDLLRDIKKEKELHLLGNKNNVTQDEAAWKQVYSALQAEALKAKDKTKEHYSILHREQVYRNIKEADRDKAIALRKQHQDQLQYARSELQQRTADRRHFEQRLEALLDSPTEKSRLAALLSRQEDPSYLEKSDDIRKILEEASHQTTQAKALAVAVTEEALTVDDSVAMEANKYIHTASSKVRLQSQTISEADDVLQSLRDLARNETWVSQKLDLLAEQEENNRASLVRTSQREEVLESQEAKAAQVLKKAIAATEEAAKQEERERLEQERKKNATARNESEIAQAVLGKAHVPLHSAVVVGAKLLFKQMTKASYSDLSSSSSFDHGQLPNETKVDVLRVGATLARVRSENGGEYEVAYQDLFRIPHMEGSSSTSTTTAVPLPTTTAAAAMFLRPTLYCFSLILPFGYEPALMQQQQEKAVGIFACDQAAVFSNSSTFLGSGRPLPVKVQVVSQSLSVPYGGKWHTALNREVFNRVWQEVVHDGTYWRYDWVVKADADTVFFPSRLVEVLQKGWSQPTLEAIVRKRKLYSDKENQQKTADTCGTCRLFGHESELCSDHARWLQEHKSMSCQDALKQIAREPPLDCGCRCNAIEACDLAGDLAWASDGGLLAGEGFEAALQKVASGNGDPGSLSNLPVYVNDCQFGLHGPIEVLSAAAVKTYVERLPECDYLVDEPWGEDKFLDRCMLTLGVTRANDFSLLSETACGEEPAPCGTSDVAFHPFKLAEDYFACWSFAHAFGHGPASPEEEEEDGTSKLLGYGSQEPVYVIGSQGEGS